MSAPLKIYQLQTDGPTAQLTYLAPRDREKYGWEIMANLEQADTEGVPTHVALQAILCEMPGWNARRFERMYACWTGWGLTRQHLIAAATITQAQDVRSNALSLMHRVCESIARRLEDIP
ncbi:MAG: hypothetical protein KatS3mg051_1598 [Anaerolineae bacterium]|nr:MAG: hypothetical protein KatS3mg051_1598 [Anaerolineae bacterium]